jgi:hypothetical protein
MAKYYFEVLNEIFFFVKSNFCTDKFRQKRNIKLWQTHLHKFIFILYLQFKIRYAL